MFLSQLFSQQRIALNVVRLLLATGVIFSHTFPLGGFGPDPVIAGGTVSIGSFCVAGFFSISGYVISQSAERSSLKTFFLSRFFRIWPGLILTLLLSAFVFMPLIQIIQGTFEWRYFSSWGLEVGGPTRYILQNVFLPINLQWDINGGPVEVPYEGSINGSLWTLPIEVRAYLVAFILVKIGLWLRRKQIFAFAVAMLGLLILLKNFLPEISANLPTLFQAVELIFIFIFAGSLAIAAKSLQTTPFIIGVASIFVIMGLVVPNGSIALCLLSPLVILIPIAAHLWKLGSSKFFENDYSYGTYIYAFPIQQAIASTKVFSEPVSFFFASLALTLMLAVPSWHFFEKPMLKLKDKIVGPKTRKFGELFSFLKVNEP